MPRGASGIIIIENVDKISQFLLDVIIYNKKIFII